MQLNPVSRAEEMQAADASRRRKQLVAATLSLLGMASGNPASAEPLK
ncbi:hypothetical protein [Nevskia ramosa]